ncbi:MAG TPA: thiamine pyrophosphate-dependent dehydrogenase E1 component subunit alpha, partial [Phycisphaerae bacterium]|nr:thiamine pyrophosphate-dependent dehydrogenase E1 component subunit alpha [Phycisphaerae bacterium]
MPKSQFVDPKEVRKAGQIDFTPIPVNQYNRTVKQELKSGKFTKEDLIRIQRDMMLLRGFENMLNEIKTKGSYAGLEYNHRGPAHLSIGQESAAVGQSYLLGVDDHTYGSHRSHSEILAKSLSAIQKLGDAELLNIMKNYFDGECLKVVEKDATGDTKALAIDYLVYGALAEIFGRKAGFNKGMGGSMHTFYPPFGLMPNNAIVGGSGDISVGAALYKKINKKPGIVIGNIGDASLGCGPVWEGLCLATMDQYKTLWDEAHRGGLPFILNFFNNFYGMGGQTCGETMGYKILARLGAGINPEQMHAERVDGFNPLAVIDAIERKKEILARGEGPVLMDTITYRFSGHSPSDAMSYRTREEVEAWQEVDPIKTFAAQLIEAGVCKQDDIDNLQQWVESVLVKAMAKAIDLNISPRTDLFKEDNLLQKTMLSNRKIENFDTS